MTTLNFIIGVIAFILLLVIIGQIGKVSDLVGKFSKTQEERYENASNANGLLFLLVGFIGMGLLVWSYFTQSKKYLPSASSELGRDWDFLFYKVFTPPILLIFFITHILLFYFAYKYRFKRNKIAQYFSHSNKLEIIWTAIPFVTMIVFGFLTIPKWVEATSKPGEDAMHIKITGMQFKWFMAYSGPDGEFGERNIRKHGELANLLGLNPEDVAGYDDFYVDELVLPVNQEVAFDLSALDVLHDFYLPHFRVKMDCVPGVPTRIKITPDRTSEQMKEITGNPNFTYEIACAELCGTGHWNMRRTIRVVEQEEFDQWAKEQTTAKELYYDSLLASLEKKKAEEAEDHSEGEHHEDDEHEEDHSTDNHSASL